MEIRVKYELPTGEHQLDLYDAGIALTGISRSLAITTEYFLSGKVIKQAPALDSARIFLRPPKAGSFEFISDIQFIASSLAPQIVQMAASGAVGNAFYDYLKFIFHRVVGKEHKNTTDYSKHIAQVDEGAIDTIVDTIEHDVANIHRPIIHNASQVIIIGGSNNIVNLNSGTYDYVKSFNTANSNDNFLGRISSYNANSGRGRVFLFKEQRVVPFTPPEDGFSSTESAAIGWSLNEYINNRPGDILLDARAVYTPNGLLKKLLVRKVVNSE